MGIIIGKENQVFLIMLFLIASLPVMPGCSHNPSSPVQSESVKPPEISSPTDGEIIALIQRADALPLEAFNKLEPASVVEDSETGNMYILFTAELDSADKMKAYLSQAWSPEAVETFMNLYKVVGGKLCYPMSNWSSIGMHNDTDKVTKRELLEGNVMNVTINGKGPDGLFDRTYQLRKVDGSWLVAYSPELDEIR
ncbi:MAG: hypothetical protein GXY34_07780 [Syntrophomonadaceae bacterium]|nr:hypothetical protein [Syntrophomonadaceae bacterium]